jgi:hypothetical protein
VIINQIHGYEVDDTTSDSVLLKIGAGEVFDKVIERTVEEGLWGLENLSAIPGSVGATPIQNVGAYGVEIGDLIVAVEAVHMSTLAVKTFTSTECAFGYRDSFFKSTSGKEWVVTRVRYNLSKVPTPVLAYKDLQPLVAASSTTQTSIREHVMAVRSKKLVAIRDALISIHIQVNPGEFVRWAIQMGFEVPPQLNSLKIKQDAEINPTNAVTKDRILTIARTLRIIFPEITDLQIHNHKSMRLIMGSELVTYATLSGWLSNNQ